MKKISLNQVAQAVAGLGTLVQTVENRYADREWAKRDIARADSIVRFGDPTAADFFAGARADAEATHSVVEKGGGKFGIKRLSSGSVYGTYDSEEEAKEAMAKAVQSEESKADAEDCAMADDDTTMGMEDEEETYLGAKNAHTLQPTRESKAALETAAYRLNQSKERAAQEREEALNVNEGMGGGQADKGKSKK